MMTAPIVTHNSRMAMSVNLTDARRALETIRRQHVEALPKVEGQLWTRLAEVAR